MKYTRMKQDSNKTEKEPKRIYFLTLYDTLCQILDENPDINKNMSKPEKYSSLFTIILVLIIST